MVIGIQKYEDGGEGDWHKKISNYFNYSIKAHFWFLNFDENRKNRIGTKFDSIKITAVNISCCTIILFIYADSKKTKFSVNC